MPSPHRHRQGPLALGALALLAAATFAATSASATSLVRMSLEALASSHSTVVVGEVVNATSYWNADGTFILTDVVLQTESVLKGAPAHSITVTLMGGQVDDLTTLIVGGAELLTGHSYVVFADRADLPGAEAVMTVRDHSQGVFEIVEGADGSLRALSQARHLHLIADAQGRTLPPGGEQGLPLDALLGAVLNISLHSDGADEKEVTQ